MNQEVSLDGSALIEKLKGEIGNLVVQLAMKDMLLDQMRAERDEALKNAGQK